MKAAIVFDMDGVLVDTEPLKFRAHRTAAEERGGGLSLDLYRREMGGVGEEVVRRFLAASGLETTAEAAAAYGRAFREAYRDELARGLRPMPGAEALLAACRREGRPLALVTSSERWMVELVLPRLGPGELFEAVVTAEDVERPKPAPDPYRRAREALGSGVPAAVAVEDTRAGVASAAAAGFPVVAVRHELNREERFERAAAVVASLSPAEAFLALADGLAARRTGYA